MNLNRTFLMIVGIGGLWIGLLGCGGEPFQGQADGTASDASTSDASTSDGSPSDGSTPPPPSGPTPVLVNFRVTDSQPTRLLFDTSKPIDELSISGFVISRKSIASVIVNSGETTGHYFVVTTAFNFWDNTTIRLGEIEDSEDRQATTHNFSLQYVENKFPEPEAATDVYVTDDASGGNGTVGSPYTLAEAVSNAAAGQTIWVKNGTYTMIDVLGKSGNASNPIKLIGYKSLDGNNHGVPYANDMVDTFTYTSHAQAVAQFDPTEYPVISGDYTDDTDAIFFAGSSYWVVKNIQMRSHTEGIDTNDTSSFFHIENCMSGDNHAVNSERGRGFRSSASSMNFRLIKNVSFDNALNNVQINGRSFLVRGNRVYSGIFSGEPSAQSTDYWITSNYAADSIWIGNHIEKIGITTHNGHGLTLKAHADSSYNLMDSNTTIHIGETNVMANRLAHHNVIRGNKVLGDKIVGISSYLVRARSGAHDNLFEYNYGENLSSGILLTANGENGPTPDESMGHDNIFRNNIVNKASRGILIGNKSGVSMSLTNNRIYNNTFVDCGVLFYENSVDPLSKSGNEFKNNIVHNSQTLMNSGVLDADWLEEHNDWWDCSFAVPAGTGNISTDPEFIDATSFIPQASGITAPKHFGTEYDYNNREREDPTTMGALKSEAE